MSLYNPLLRVAQMAKTGEVSGTLKATSETFQKAGAAGVDAVRRVGDAPGVQTAIGRFGKYFGIPAGVGAGVGLGAYAAGTGIKEGLGFSDATDAVKKSSGVVLFLVLLIAGVFVLGKLLAMKKG
ncbi:hypothetical protein FGU65_09295 [Methanoculleus sp. FWC-SCC1]|uniref:Uncharacterized protein n=1 Tax=Methanoculleus frigidifontis TaxID=2584085 RepID=A0ABT8MAZ0_9EURY|nr:hypothetical protein [Methanoculleus sp. FWC-SCC1]MDN7025079.1 hypothetical protein [Methanoculleus sp. FWC-SCC1]